MCTCLCLMFIGRTIFLQGPSTLLWFDGCIPCSFLISLLVKSLDTYDVFLLLVLLHAIFILTFLSFFLSFCFVWFLALHIFHLKIYLSLPCHYTNLLCLEFNVYYWINQSTAIPCLWPIFIMRLENQSWTIFVCYFISSLFPEALCDSLVLLPIEICISWAWLDIMVFEQLLGFMMMSFRDSLNIRMFWIVMVSIFSPFIEKQVEPCMEVFYVLRKMAIAKIGCFDVCGLPLNFVPPWSFMHLFSIDTGF